MCKLKHSSVAGKNTPQKADLVRVLSFVIIAICIVLLLALLCIMVYRTMRLNPEVHRVIVTTDSLPDSLRAHNSLDYEQADSLIRAIRSYDEQLNQKYQYLIEQKEQNNQIFSWGSLIVGIVVAVFGWFGFQSFSTIEDKAQRKAQSVANRTAWKATNQYLKDKAPDQIEDVAKQSLQKKTVEKVKGMVLNELNTIIENRLKLYSPSDRIDAIENRIGTLENSLGARIDDAVDEAVQVIFNKYRRPTKDSSERKEEKQ